MLHVLRNHPVYHCSTPAPSSAGPVPPATLAQSFRRGSNLTYISLRGLCCTALSGLASHPFFSIIPEPQPCCSAPKQRWRKTSGTAPEGKHALVSKHTRAVGSVAVLSRQGPRFPAATCPPCFLQPESTKLQVNCCYFVYFTEKIL